MRSAKLSLPMFVAVLAGVALAQDKKPAPAHADFDALLKRYVNDKGDVDYKTWKAKDTGALDAYLERLAATDESKLSKDEKTAFWLDAHNAVTIRAVLEFHPISSVKDKVSHSPWGYNLWKEYKKRLAGQQLSLEQIVNEKLRKLGEPRVHFAACWAAKGSPLLRREAYEAAQLDAQLEDQVQRFLGSTTYFKLDTPDQEACVCEIFKWYGEDFGDGESKQLAWLAAHVTYPDTKKYLLNPKTSFEWIDFDWALNER
jgi:hypothetical protein